MPIFLLSKNAILSLCDTVTHALVWIDGNALKTLTLKYTRISDSVCRTHLEHKDGKMGEGGSTCPFFSCHNSLVIREETVRERRGTGADLPNDENGQKEGREGRV